MNVPTFDLNLLAVLDAVLTERSVTRAARRLGLSQPAASNALSRLRVQLRDPLVIRTAEGVAPTEFALQLVGPVRQALLLLQDAVASQETLDPSKISRTFTLAMTDFAQFAFLPPILALLGREAPGIRFHVMPWPREGPRVGLEQGDIDFAIGHLGAPPDGLHARALFEDRFVCIARADHPRIHKRLTLSLYTELTHVVVSAHAAPSANAIDRFLAKQKLERKIGLRVPNFLMVPPIVASTEMIAALGLRVAEPFAKFYNLRVLDPPFPAEERTFFLLWHERTESAKAHAWVRERIEFAASVLNGSTRRRSPPKRTARDDAALRR